MTIKIENIDDLEVLAEKVIEYSRSMEEAADAAQNSFEEKLDGSVADSINEFIEVMNQLKIDAFAELPSITLKFANSLNKYHMTMKEEGFVYKVKSDENEIVNRYCPAVMYAEHINFREQSEKIKEVVNEIADTLTEVDYSKIGTYLEELESELETATNEIQETSAILQDAQGIFKEELVEICGELNECMDRIDNIMNIVDPKSGLNPESFMRLIKDGTGMAIPFLIQSENMTKEDIQALEYLSENDYGGFFKLDPDNVSDEIYSVVVNKVLNMVKFPKEGEVPSEQKELEQFVNALFKQDEENIESHAMKILAMNDLKLLQYNETMALINEKWIEKTEKELKGKGLEATFAEIQESNNRMEKDINKLKSLSVLWESLIVIGTPTTPNGKEKFGSWANPETRFYRERHFDISELTLSHGGDFEYNLNKEESIYNEMGEIAIGPYDYSRTVNAMTHSDAISQVGAEARHRIKEIGEQKSKELERMVSNIGLIGADAYIEGVSTVVSLIRSIASLNPTASGKNALSLDTTNKLLLGQEITETVQKNVKTSLSITDEIIKTQNKLLDLDKKEEEEKQKILHRMLDLGGKEVKVDRYLQGGKDTISVSTEVPTKEVINRVKELESNGFMGYVNSRENGTVLSIELGKNLGQLGEGGEELKNPKGLTKEEEFIYYGSRGPNKVKLEEVDFKDLSDDLYAQMYLLGLDGDGPEEWIRDYGK